MFFLRIDSTELAFDAACCTLFRDLRSCEIMIPRSLSILVSSSRKGAIVVGSVIVYCILGVRFPTLMILNVQIQLPLFTPVHNSVCVVLHSLSIFNVVCRSDFTDDLGVVSKHFAR